MLGSTTPLPFLVRFQSNLVGIDSVCQEKEQVLSVAQPEVTNAHVRNLACGLLTNLPKVPKGQGQKNASIPVKF